MTFEDAVVLLVIVALMAAGMIGGRLRSRDLLSAFLFVLAAVMVYPILWFLVLLPVRFVLPVFGVGPAVVSVLSVLVPFGVCATIFVLHLRLIDEARRCDVRLGIGETGVGNWARRRTATSKTAVTRRRLGFIKPPWFGDERTFTAFTLTAANCGCLWWWTWVQFLVAFLYGFPVVGSGFRATPMALGLYLPIPGLGLNLPQLFLTITVVGVAILAPAAWSFTKGASGRLRMLGLLAISATIALGFSTSVVRWRGLHVSLAESEAAWLRTSENAKRIYWNDEWRERAAAEIEEMLEALRESK